MIYVRLADTELNPSALGFGCAAMMGGVGRRASLRALAQAYDEGVTYFDTARSYGYGRAEGLLGVFLQGRRQRVILATKFGITASPMSAYKRFALPLARTVTGILPRSRQIIRRRAAEEFTHHRFTPDNLQQSLDSSLRALRSDYVDILFLHSPPPAALNDPQLWRELDAVTRSGKVRYIGIAGGVEALGVPKPDAARNAKVIQTAGELLPRINPSYIQSTAVVANQPFGGRVNGSLASVRNRLISIASGPAAPPLVKQKLGCCDDEVIADVMLNIPLRIHHAHIVLPSMFRPAHIHANVKVVGRSRFADDELEIIYRGLTAAASPPALSQ